MTKRDKCHSEKRLQNVQSRVKRVVATRVTCVWLAGCLHSWYRAKKLSAHVVFLLLRKSSLGKNSFLLPLSSARIRVSSLRLFLSWSSISSTRVKSACFACMLFQLCFYTLHTVYEEAFRVIMAISSKFSFEISNRSGKHERTRWRDLMIFRIDRHRCATKDCLFPVNKSYTLSKYEWIGQAYTATLNKSTERSKTLVMTGEMSSPESPCTPSGLVQPVQSTHLG